MNRTNRLLAVILAASFATWGALPLLSAEPSKDELVRRLQCRAGQDCETPPPSRRRSFKRSFIFEPATEEGRRQIDDAAKEGRLPSADIEVYFDFDQVEVTQAAQRTLRPLGEALNDAKLADYRFLLAGHTDAKGDEAYNQALSERRAAAIKDFLVRTLGIAPERLATYGRGKSQPKNAADPFAAENRRVQVINVGPTTGLDDRTQVATDEEATTSSPPLEVEIDLPRRKYRIGDPFSFMVTATRDCYFLVFTVDASDKVELHDPVASGAYMGNPVLKAGERRQIPVADAPGRAVIKPPAGFYEIGAVCSREQLDKLGLTQARLGEPASRGRRSFQFHLEEAAKGVDHAALGRVTMAYEVLP
jgi:outer membrane protein OmpA-like peptidoglycan-associated protein